MNPPSARREIRELFETITQVFSRLDLGAYRGCYRLPCVIASDAGVTVLADDTAFEQAFAPLVARLREQGFARSAVLHQHIALLGERTALASVLWARYGGDDEELERLGATYTLSRGDDGWRIVAIIGHGPDRVLALEND